MTTVDVLITAYNKAHSIKQVVETSIEVEGVSTVIVVDDKSTDGTSEILRSLQLENKCLKLFFNDRNLGVAESRNKLIDISTSDYICFVDGDDKIIPEEKARQIRHAIKHSLDLSYSDYMRQSDNTIYRKASQFSKQRILKSNIIPFSSTIVKKSRISHRFKDINHEDYLFWLENILDGDIKKISYHREATFYYTYIKGSRSSNIFKNLIATYKIQRRYLKIYQVILNLCTVYFIQGLLKRI